MAGVEGEIQVDHFEQNTYDRIYVTRLSDPNYAVYVNWGVSGSWSVILGKRDPKPPKGREPFLYVDTYPERNFTIAGTPEQFHLDGIRRMLVSEQVSLTLINLALTTVETLRQNSP